MDGHTKKNIAFICGSIFTLSNMILVLKGNDLIKNRSKKRIDEDLKNPQILCFILL